MIHNFSFQDLPSVPGLLCLEKDFALADQFGKIPFVNESFQTDMLLLFFCRKGQMQLSLGDRTQQIAAGDVYVCKPRETIGQVLASQDCQAWVLFYTPRIIDHLLPARLDVAKMLENDFNPLVRFGEQMMNDRLFMLLDLLRQQVQNEHLPFHSQTVFHLFATLLFNVINHCCKTPAADAEEKAASEPGNRADVLFKQFIQAMNEDNGCHRTVTWYADLLCISPKHLAKIIKAKTGNSALHVINEHAIQQIKLDLKLTDAPISELAMKYNFSNFSFFCQFARQHLGMTPQEYREK